MNKYLALILFPLPGLLITVIILVFGWLLFPGIIHGEVEKQIRLIPGSDTWNKWKEAPIPIYLDFYVYHITNPDEVERGLTPKFEEKGPYSYLQKRKKVDIKQENGKNTVKYREVKTYFFDQGRSGENKENDLVTVCNGERFMCKANLRNLPDSSGSQYNVIVWYIKAVIHTIKKMIPLDLVAGLVGNIILFEEPFLRRNVPVKELLFDGFDVTKYTNSLLAGQLPKEFAGGRFGLYKGKNGTASEEWEIFTGIENSTDFGRLKTWDGRDQFGFWQKFSPCDQVRGTDGSVFQPFITKDTVLEIFSSDVCRSLRAVFSEETEHLDIPGYIFRAASNTFSDPREEESNRCFCLEQKLDDCPGAGALPLESCTKAPIWMSSPHFLEADKRYLSDSGLDPPVREKHETFIAVEPTTGLTLKVHKRIQINLEVRYNRKVRSLQRLTKDFVLLPLIWADENAELTEKLADEIKSQLFTPQKIVGIAKWIILVLGIALFTIGLAYAVQKYLLNNNSANKKAGMDLARSASLSSKNSESKNTNRRSRGTIGPSQKSNRQPSSSSSTESGISYATFKNLH